MSGDEPVLLADLQKVATAATPGPWRVLEGEPGQGCMIQEGPQQHVLAYSLPRADAEFIATFDPPTVLKLLAVVEAARKRIGGSHAMACPSYGGYASRGCDCGRDDLKAALEALDE